MLSNLEFETIITNQESSILDFKKEMYPFENDNDLNITSKFTKDVICFCNTIRKEPSYIVIGIEDHPNGEKEFLGLDKHVDDAMLQEKIKDKVYPRPIFSYYTFAYKQKTYGILEFPIVKYPIPLAPVVKLKGLEVGKVYYRSGSSNTEALAIETIRIYDWLQNLPTTIVNGNLSSQVSSLIKKLTENEIKLSTILAEIYELSIQNKIDELTKFCISELQGISNNTTTKKTGLNYRIQNVFVSLNKIEINPYFSLTDEMLKKEFSKNEDFWESKILFTQSLIRIEEIFEKFKKKPNQTVATFELNSKDLLPNSDFSNHPLFVYVFADTISNLYQNIRQKTIDTLIKIA